MKVSRLKHNAHLPELKYTFNLFLNNSLIIETFISLLINSINPNFSQQNEVSYIFIIYFMVQNGINLIFKISFYNSTFLSYELYFKLGNSISIIIMLFIHMKSYHNMYRILIIIGNSTEICKEKS